MKKITFALILIMLSFTSCYKDIIGKCGVVIDHDTYVPRQGGYMRLFLVVKFDDGTKKRVPVETYDWVNYSRGERICW
jgi:hypothetical protein